MLASADLAVMAEWEDIYLLMLLRAHSVAVVVRTTICERCSVLRRACRELRIAFHSTSKFRFPHWLNVVNSIFPRKKSSL